MSNYRQNIDGENIHEYDFRHRTHQPVRGTYQGQMSQDMGVLLEQALKANKFFESFGVAMQQGAGDASSVRLRVQRSLRDAVERLANGQDRIGYSMISLGDRFEHSVASGFTNVRGAIADEAEMTRYIVQRSSQLIGELISSGFDDTNRLIGNLGNVAENIVSELVEMQASIGQANAHLVGIHDTISSVGGAIDQRLGAIEHELATHEARHMETFRYADSLLRMGHTNEARSLYQSIIQQRPAHYPSHIRLCQIYCLEGNNDIAYEYLDRFSASAPQYLSRWAYDVREVMLSNLDAGTANFLGDLGAIPADSNDVHALTLRFRKEIRLGNSGVAFSVAQNILFSFPLFFLENGIGDEIGNDWLISMMQAAPAQTGYDVYGVAAMYYFSRKICVRVDEFENALLYRLQRGGGGDLGRVSVILREYYDQFYSLYRLTM